MQSRVSVAVAEQVCSEMAVEQLALAEGNEICNSEEFHVMDEGVHQ